MEKPKAMISYLMHLSYYKPPLFRQWNLPQTDTIKTPKLSVTSPLGTHQLYKNYCQDKPKIS